MLENLHRLLPGRLLLVVYLSQVKDVALNNPVIGAALVLDDAPVTMLLAIFLSRATAQNITAPDYARKFGGGNRLGLHYKLFLANPTTIPNKSGTCPLEKKLPEVES